MVFTSVHPLTYKCCSTGICNSDCSLLRVSLPALADNEPFVSGFFFNENSDLKRKETRKPWPKRFFSTCPFLSTGRDRGAILMCPENSETSRPEAETRGRRRSKAEERKKERNKQKKEENERSTCRREPFYGRVAITERKSLSKGRLIKNVFFAAENRLDAAFMFPFLTFFCWPRKLLGTAIRAVYARLDVRRVTLDRVFYCDFLFDERIFSVDCGAGLIEFPVERGAIYGSSNADWRHVTGDILRSPEVSGMIEIFLFSIFCFRFRPMGGSGSHSASNHRWTVHGGAIPRRYWIETLFFLLFFYKKKKGPRW